MTRWLAGVFDPSARTDSSHLARALEPHAATVAELGPLQVAYSGEPNPERAPLCLLDGFLDNAAELAAELDCHGATDEQLLAAGWRRWGRELPARMRGDFALLVWDEQRGEGLLARDQLGVRSLFLHEASGALCFASEIRHLLALLPRRPAPDPVSVAHWITMSNRPGSATLYQGVRRPALLHGLEVSHASAVVQDGEVIALLGPSRAGKTSLALELCARGASFMADDVLALETRDGALFAHPGSPVAGIALEHEHEHERGRKDNASDEHVIAVNARERIVQVVGAEEPAALGTLLFLDRKADGPKRPSFEPRADAQLLLAATFNFVLATPERLQRLLEVAALAAQLRVDLVSCGPDTGVRELADAVEERLTL